MNKIRNHNGRAFDMSPLLHNALSNNICGVVVGQRFDYNDKSFLKMVDIVTSAFGDSVTAVVNRLIICAPILQHIPPISIFHKRFLKTVQSIIDWIRDIVDEHERTFDENSIRDFIDAFIVEKRKGKDKFFQNAQLRHYIVDLFVAGTESTTSAIRWSLLYMLHFPVAQKKLRNEIINVVGSSGTVSMAHKVHMPYTNAFMQELSRFRTLAPLGVPHQANADTELEGYVIPKGTQIFSNFWAVHNDPNLWKDPEKFIPERFLDEEGNFINSNYVIPFSFGPRHCLGEQLARMEIFLFLVGLVQKFEFLPDPNASELPSIDDGVVGLGFVPAPFTIVAKEL